jgi:hypothetical protein
VYPIYDDVVAFHGPDKRLDATQVESHLDTVTAMVRAYVRDRGFTYGEPADDLARVIVSSTARLVGNPEHNIEETVGVFSVRHGVFNGWTLPELAVLNRYRKRAA